MDELLNLKVQNTINEIENILFKQYKDLPHFETMLLRSSQQMKLLLSRIENLESRINNSEAENQRLSQLAKY
jgi:2-oxoglutarate dehydrogenase complex dehydrogenase (E1) component-like enzyme